MQTNVSRFTELPNWQSNSCDLNSVDYLILGTLQQLVYRKKFMNIDFLKQVLDSCWDMITQELINIAIDQWSKRLMLVICSYDGHIQHHFR